MTLLILAIIVGGALILIGLALPRMTPDAPGRRMEEVRRVRAVLPIIGVLVIVLGVLLASFRIVPGGHVGVQVLFGRIIDQPLSEGLNLDQSIQAGAVHVGPDARRCSSTPTSPARKG